MPKAKNKKTYKKMKFEKTKIENAILGQTLKKRTWSRYKIGDQVFTCHRCYKEVLDEFRNECEKELKGLYRNHEIRLTKEQEAWKKHLMKTKYSLLLTIKLPHTNQDGYRRTRNRTKALELYKKLIQELECSFCGTSNWRRNPLHFVGVLEHGKAGFWHVHLAIPCSDNELYVLDQLCKSIAEITNKHAFYKTVMDLTVVYDQEGVCLYMLKELRGNDLEGSEIFELRHLFAGIKKDRYIVRMSLKALRLLVKFGLWIKQALSFNVHKPTRYVKGNLSQKRLNRSGSKINPSSNFDPA